MLADKILKFFQDLRISTSLPEGVGVLNPYQDPEAFRLCEQFYRKYYNDDHKRYLILGINPGRLGGGLTGIPFTDPIKLEKYCSITNTLQKKTELSADFIYAMIDAYGGTELFYKHFYFSSASPLGFVMNGKNLNYYDIRELQESLRPFIVQSLRDTVDFGMHTAVCYCLGEDKNFKYLSRLNDELKIFGEIIPLAHPRFIMQYRRKRLAEYIEGYVEKLNLTTRNLK